MERALVTSLVLLVIISGCDRVAGQLRPPPVIRPPAIPPGAGFGLEVRAPAPPVGLGPVEEPRPPAPPPHTDRACVVRHVGRLRFRRECVIIKDQCRQRNCPIGTVCGLNLDEEIECFPENVREFQHCAMDHVRLSQPCPADSGITGFGMGCTFCRGANPFISEPVPPPSGRLIGEVLPPAPISSRACVVSISNIGERSAECIDISDRCRQKRCPPDTVCALDVENNIRCLSEPQTRTRNCHSEKFRLEQPCPADSGINGFGMGCTYCGGGNPFVRGGPEPPPPQPPTPPSNRACLVVHMGSGRFKSECVDISARCAVQNCPPGTVCGLNHDETIECFPESVRNGENCGPEEFRLEQPCPSDSGIAGFGMGCTFCFGANPFSTRSPRQLVTTTQRPSRNDRACVYRHIRDGRFKKECRSIRAECARKRCPADTVCGLDLDENIVCFDKSVRDLQECADEATRLHQPCPADSGILGFGMGCTFCDEGGVIGPGRTTPRPTREPGSGGSDQSIVDRVACISRITPSGQPRRGCLDITDLCERRRCPADRICALDINEQPSCFAASQLNIRNCGTPRERVIRPCPGGTKVLAFGAGCTYCLPPPTLRPTAAPGSPRRACPVTRGIRRCESIETRCARLACAETCALGLDGEPRCLTAADMTLANCGPEQHRLDQPCWAGMTALAFGAGCTFCRPL